MPEITLYATGTCPWCLRAEQLLHARGASQIHKIRVDLQPEAREQMIARTGRRTVPQIYIGEQHIGGYDDLAALDHSGGLTPLLKTGQSLASSATAPKPPTHP